MPHSRANTSPIGTEVSPRRHGGTHGGQFSPCVLRVLRSLWLSLLYESLGSRARPRRSCGRLFTYTRGTRGPTPVRTSQAFVPARSATSQASGRRRRGPPRPFADAGQVGDVEHGEVHAHRARDRARAPAARANAPARRACASVRGHAVRVPDAAWSRCATAAAPPSAPPYETARPRGHVLHQRDVRGDASSPAARRLRRRAAAAAAP